VLDLDEDELSTRLHRAMTGLRASPELAANVRRRQARRQRGFVAVLTGSVAAAVVVGSVMILTPPAAAPVAGTGPAVTDVAFVVEHTSATMASAVGDSVLKQREVTVNNGAGRKGETRTFVYWTDATTKGRHAERLDAHNKVLFTAVFPAGGDGITADHSAKTWWPEKFGPIGQVMSTRGFLEPAPLPDPTELKKWQVSGKLKLVGTETLNGTETLHLQFSMIGLSKDFWVDAKTYLPAKYVADGKGAGTTTVEYSWLPRTPENLAPFEVKPPAGFTKIPRPAPTT
jgi:hypothetical protein